MARRCCAPPLPEEPYLAIHERSGPSDSKSSDAAGGKFERQCDPVDSATEVSDDWSIGISQHKGNSAGNDALDEEPHRRETHRFTGCESDGSLRWTRQRRQAIDLLAFNLQRLTARCQNVYSGCFAENSLGHRRRRLDEMLTVVEHQQHPPIANKRQKILHRTIGIDRKIQRRRNRAGYERRVIDCSKIDEMNRAAKLRDLGMSDRYRHRRLADATRPYDCHEASAKELFGNRLDGFVASHHPQQASGQLGVSVCNPAFGKRRRAPNGRHEAIAAARDIGHVADARLTVAEDLPKRGDMEAQAALFDDEIRPDPRHQLPLADDFGCTLDERAEKVERAAAKMERDTIPLEEPLRREETEGTERDEIFTLRTLPVEHRLFRLNED